MIVTQCLPEALGETLSTRPRRVPASAFKMVLPDLVFFRCDCAWAKVDGPTSSEVVMVSAQGSDGLLRCRNGHCQQIECLGQQQRYALAQKHPSSGGCRPYSAVVFAG